MKSNNLGEMYKKKVEAVHRQLAQEMVTRSQQLGETFVAETKKRTPGDKEGGLRGKWAAMPVEKKGDKYIIKITNPAEYAAYVEFGYMQRPGMILKMKEDKGKLRFVGFLGYSQKYGLRDPTGKVPPDEDGNVVIVTRKRFIKGRFMARDALEEMKKTHWPKVKKMILKNMKKTWEKTQ